MLRRGDMNIRKTCLSRDIGPLSQFLLFLQEGCRWCGVYLSQTVDSCFWNPNKTNWHIPNPNYTTCNNTQHITTFNVHLSPYKSQTFNTWLFPLRGWQPTLVLGLACGSDDYSEIPCVLLRQLIRERKECWIYHAKRKGSISYPRWVWTIRGPRWANSEAERCFFGHSKLVQLSDEFQIFFYVHPYWVNDEIWLQVEPHEAVAEVSRIGNV